MNKQAVFDPAAIPTGYAAREVRNHLIVSRVDVEQDLGLYFTRSFEELTALPGAQRVAAGRAGPVHFPVAEATARIFVRPYAHGGALGGARGRIFSGPGRALGELAVTARAAALDLPVPPLIAITATRLEARRWVMQAWSWWLPNATSLALALPGLASSPAARRSLLSAVAAAVGRCHDGGLRHADLNGRNVLVERSVDAWRVRIIDLDKAAIGAKLTPAERLAQLARLYRSLAKDGLLPSVVGAPEFGAFTREATGDAVTGPALDEFLARCARTARRHALLWRLSGAWRRAHATLSARRRPPPPAR